MRNLILLTGFLAILAGVSACTGTKAQGHGNKTVVTFWYTSGKFPLEKLIRDYNASQDSIFIVRVDCRRKCIYIYDEARSI